MNYEKKNMLNFLNMHNKYQNGNYKININDEYDSHAVICSNVFDKSVVLEVGFGQGAISKCLIEDKNCIVDGSEIDEKAIESAISQNYFRNIYNLNNTSVPLKNKYDVIIFADVLEHVYDPIALINQYSKNLKKDGYFLVSIPNISYSDVIVNLINDEFNYDLKGLLDNTHIRFFTLTSFFRYFYEYNLTTHTNIYDIQHLKSIYLKSYNETKYKNVYSFFNKRDYFNSYQHILKIFKVNSKDNTTKIIKFLSNNNFDNVKYLDELLSDELPFLLKNKNIINYIDGLNTSFEKKYNTLINEHDKAILDIESNHEKLILDMVLKHKNILLSEKKKSESKIKDIVLKDKVIIDSLNNEISSLLNSKSWRITKPLRFFASLFKKNRNL